MKNRIIALLVVLLISMSGVQTFAESTKSVEIYVSENGNDLADGTISAPLKSVSAAVSLAEKYRAENNSVRIIFRGGTYRFSKTISISDKLSGTKDVSTTFEAYDNEEVNFKASVPLDVSQAKPVEDSEILDRLYKDVRNKVVVIDLKQQGISQNDILLSQNINGMYALAGWEDSWVEANGLYLNDKEQPLSRWPNDRHYVRWTSSVGQQSFVYSESNPSRWTKAKDFWVGGFPQYDYSYIRMSVKEIDPVEKVITVIDNPVVPFSSYMTRRWAAFNLLEEIDVPGEYYIDRENMNLYYYPPHNLEGQSLELSLLGRAMFDIRKASNITFKNLNISQSRSNAIFMENVDNIDFLECSFKDIDVNAIFCRGTQRAITSGNHWQYQYKDASYNIDIKSCDFYNMGMAAVDLPGGNIDILKMSNNVIEDCFIQRTAQKSFWEALSIRGCGVTVRNNNISFSPQQAIRPWGCLHMIENNEFSDILRENDDCGVIYWGGNSLLRGTMVQYNYFHDCSSIEEMVYNHKSSVYWDDGQSSMSAQNNIFANIEGRSIFSNGAGDTLHRYNTSVNLQQEWYFADHPKRENEIVTDDVFGTVAEAMNDIYDKELYFEKWPALEALSRGINPKKFTKIYENLAVNCGDGFVGLQEQKFSSFTDNVFLKNTDEVDYNDMFVDPENQDFRLKKDSEMAKKNPNLLNEENFDIEKIGMYRDMTFNEETSSFRMLLPENGNSSVSSSAADFAWEHAYGANHYRLVVATDPELKNVVFDDIVRYTHTTLDCLEKGTVYYWTVYAINNSREFASTWQSVGKVHAFATGVEESINTYELANVIAAVNERVKIIKEGNNPGDYKVGTSELVKMYINILNFLVDKKPLSLTQAKLDNATSFLNSILNGEGMVAPGYMDIADRLGPENWTGQVKADGKSVVMAPDKAANTFGGTTTFEYMTGNIVYCFDAEFENCGDGSWMTFGLSQRNDVHQYQATNPGYYICIKENLVELQKTDNQGNKVLETKAFPLSDGKRHSIQMGRIKIETGNIFFINVDGDNLFTYYDVDGSELKGPSQLSMCTYKVGEKIALYPYSGEVPDQNKYEEMKKRELNNSIKPIYNLYSEDLKNYSILNTGHAKVLNSTGLYNVSDKPVIKNDDDIYVTAEIFEKMCDAKVDVDGSRARITSSDKNVEVSVSYMDNVPMFLIEEACVKLDKSYTYDWQNQNVFVGDSGSIIVMNTLTKTKKTREMFEIMANAEDMVFDK